MSDAAPKTLVEDRGSVRILTINNVKQRNALTMDVKAVFGPALAEAERDPNVRAIVITGAGGTFSAGGDVTLFGDMTPAKGRHVVYRQREFLHTMIRGETTDHRSRRRLCLRRWVRRRYGGGSHCGGRGCEVLRRIQQDWPDA